MKRKRKFNIVEDFRQSLALFSPQFFENRINLNELEIKDDKIIYNCKKENRLNKWKTNEIGIPDFYGNIYKTNYTSSRYYFNSITMFLITIYYEYIAYILYKNIIKNYIFLL